MDKHFNNKTKVSKGVVVLDRVRHIIHSEDLKTHLSLSINNNKSNKISDNNSNMNSNSNSKSNYNFNVTNLIGR